MNKLTTKKQNKNAAKQKRFSPLKIESQNGTSSFVVVDFRNEAEVSRCSKNLIKLSRDINLFSSSSSKAKRSDPSGFESQSDKAKNTLAIFRRDDFQKRFKASTLKGEAPHHY